MDVPAGVTQEEGRTGFLLYLPSAVLALIFLARRIQPLLSLVDREAEFLCTNELIILHLLGIFFFCQKKIPGSTEILHEIFVVFHNVRKANRYGAPKIQK